MVRTGEAGEDLKGVRVRPSSHLGKMRSRQRTGTCKGPGEKWPGLMEELREASRAGQGQAMQGAMGLRDRRAPWAMMTIVGAWPFL